MISDLWLSEDKFTDNKSFSIKKVTWEKIKKEAYKQDKTPCMHLDISDLELVVLSKDDFDWLLEGGHLE